MNLRVLVPAIGFAAVSLLPAIAQDHPFSVKDDIAMVRLSESSSDSDALDSEMASQSPDGDYVAIITTRGILALDQIESDLLIFRLKRYPRSFETPDHGLSQV